MSTKRPVSERDFRMPEFRDADPNDYEFREDGKIVRKDRWEQGIRSIVSIVRSPRSDFEIDEVIEEIRLKFRVRHPQEIIDQTNQVAQKIANWMGFELEHGEFHRATADRAQGIWKLACQIQEFMTETDVENALAEIEAEESEQ